jgi:hypothetical protein
MFDQCSATRAMEHLCQAGLQARPFSRGENDNGKIVGRHKPNHSAGAASISQMPRVVDLWKVLNRQQQYQRGRLRAPEQVSPPVCEERLAW